MTLVLQWIKSHLIIVIMIAISLIVPPIIIVMASQWNDRIAQEIKTRVNKQDSSLKAVERTQVVIKPLEPGVTGVDETRVINQRVLDDYKQLRNAIKTDADDIEQAAMKVNESGKEKQLVEGLLPEPPTGLAEELPYKLHDSYIEAHKQLLEKINAGMPPASDKVADQLVDYNQNYRRSQLNAGPTDVLNDEEMKKLNESMTKQRLALYAQASNEYSMYADTSVFNLQQWTNNVKPDEYRWYEWQATYWLDYDLVTAFDKANRYEGDRTTIIGNPVGSVVKRIIAIKPALIFPASLVTGNSQQPGNQYGNSGGFGRDMNPPLSNHGGDGAPPMGEGGMIHTSHGDIAAPTNPSAGGAGAIAKVSEDTFADPKAEFPLDYSNSITGHFGKTGLYDVRLVNVALVVDSNRLQQLFDAINTTDFMTVTSMSVMNVDVESDLAQGFYYGPEPVVQVNMTIETLWLRDWTTKFMPAPVKTFFGIKTPDANAAGQPDASNQSSGGGTPPPVGGGRRFNPGH